MQLEGLNLEARIEAGRSYSLSCLHYGQGNRKPHLHRYPWFRLLHGRWSEDFLGLPTSLVQMKVPVVAAKQGGTSLPAEDPHGLGTVVFLAS